MAIAEHAETMNVGRCPRCQRLRVLVHRYPASAHPCHITTTDEHRGRAPLTIRRHHPCGPGLEPLDPRPLLNGWTSPALPRNEGGAYTMP